MPSAFSGHIFLLFLLAFYVPLSLAWGTTTIRSPSGINVSNDTPTPHNVSTVAHTEYIIFASDDQTENGNIRDYLARGLPPNRQKEYGFPRLGVEFWLVKMSLEEFREFVAKYPAVREDLLCTTHCSSCGTTAC